MLAPKFAMGPLLGLGLFQRDELGLGQYQPFLGALGLQYFEPLGLEVMPLKKPRPAEGGTQNGNATSDGNQSLSKLDESALIAERGSER